MYTKIDKNSLNSLKPVVAFTINNEDTSQLEIFFQPGDTKTQLKKKRINLKKMLV